jgi:hypothetical protein
MRESRNEGLWNDRCWRRVLLIAARELAFWGLIEQGLSGPFIELPCYRAEFGLAM